jgi:T-complex protein 1 subunit gamma
MIELSRAQDEEVGDGTTSVIILAGEVLTAVESFIEKQVHPTVIVSSYFKALDQIPKIVESIGQPVDIENREDLARIVNSSIGTKFASRWGSLVVDLAVKAVQTVYRKEGDKVEIDVKRYAKVEKIPGGTLEDC